MSRWCPHTLGHRTCGSPNTGVDGGAAIIPKPCPGPLWDFLVMSRIPRIRMAWVTGPIGDYTMCLCGGVGQCFQNPKSFSGIPL